MSNNKRDVKNFSSIQVSNESKARLKALALTPRESYENIILRLLKVKLGNREICYTIESRCLDDCSIECVVDWGSDSANIRFKNFDGDLKFRFPVSYGDVDVGVWSDFRDCVLGSDNLLSNLSVLDVDECIVFGDLLLKRVS